MKNEIKFIQITSEELENLIDKGIKNGLEGIKKDLSEQREQEKIMTREQTAQLLDIDLSTLWRWTKKGRIKAHSIGDRVYYFLSDINRALLPIN
ncbi:DNA-binding protein [Apibacter muscae]|uniref:helix-turn-helix domain-containing protein n=1 Tax=Apibacter muscae TaxID=2509004 RepID=UPI0011ACD88A|nr:helix-turn-helix domain-containing protein [Apibacter muscae]TWP29246.1 DNA-binding protein [Apibacter muscae]